LLEDCAAASSQSIHDQILNCYRRNPIHPLFRVIDSLELAEELTY
jgi:hypothetical protein